MFKKKYNIRNEFECTLTSKLILQIPNHNILSWLYNNCSIDESFILQYIINNLINKHNLSNYDNNVILKDDIILNNLINQLNNCSSSIPDYIHFNISSQFANLFIKYLFNIFKTTFPSELASDMIYRRKKKKKTCGIYNINVKPVDEHWINVYNNNKLLKPLNWLSNHIVNPIVNRAGLIEYLRMYLNNNIILYIANYIGDPISSLKIFLKYNISTFYHNNLANNLIIYILYDLYYNNKLSWLDD